MSLRHGSCSGHRRPWTLAYGLSSAACGCSTEFFEGPATSRVTRYVRLRSLGRAFRQLLVLVVVSLSMDSASAFEIRPIGCAGAYADANAEQLIFAEPGHAPSPCGVNSAGNIVVANCRDSGYMTDIRGNQPVHEAITRQAYRDVQGRPIASRNFASPWIAGVVWNDDPEWLLRKFLFDSGISKLRQFADAIAEGESHPQSSRLMIRSHFGDMQFLHAMRGPGQTDEQFRRSLRAWIEAAHAVATGRLRSTASLKEAGLDAVLGKVACPLVRGGYCKTLRDLFDPDGSKFLRHHSAAEGESYMANMAAGTVMHIIQDAHSRSHMRIEPGVGGLSKRVPLTYDDENRKAHCARDMATTETREDIEAARAATVQYLRLWKSKSSTSEVMKLIGGVGIELTSPLDAAPSAPTSGIR